MNVKQFCRMVWLISRRRAYLLVLSFLPATLCPPPPQKKRHVCTEPEWRTKTLGLSFYTPPWLKCAHLFTRAAERSEEKGPVKLTRQLSFSVSIDALAEVSSDPDNSRGTVTVNISGEKGRRTGRGSSKGSRGSRFHEPSKPCSVVIAWTSPRLSFSFHCESRPVSPRTVKRAERWTQHAGPTCQRREQRHGAAWIIKDVYAVWKRRKAAGRGGEGALLGKLVVIDATVELPPSTVAFRHLYEGNVNISR